MANQAGALVLSLPGSIRNLSGTATLFIGAVLLLTIVAMANIGTLSFGAGTFECPPARDSCRDRRTVGRLRGDAALEGALVGAAAGRTAVAIASWLRAGLGGFLGTAVASGIAEVPIPAPVLRPPCCSHGARRPDRHRCGLRRGPDGGREVVARRGGSRRQKSRWRLALVGLQVTAAMIAAVAAARLAASARYISHLGSGYETDHLVTAQLPIWSTPLGTDEGAQRLVARIGPAITVMPGLGDPAVWATFTFRMPRSADDVSLAIEERDLSSAFTAGGPPVPPRPMQ